MPRSTSQLDVDWLLGAPAPSRTGRVRAAWLALLVIGGLSGLLVAGWPWFSQRWLHRELVEGWQAAVLAEDAQRALELLEPLGGLLPESLPQLTAALGHPDESVRRAACRHLERWIDRSQVESGGERSLWRLVDHLGGIQPELPVTGQLLLTGLLSRTMAVLLTQPAAESGELAMACQNLMDAAHGRLRATRRVIYQIDNLAATLAPPLAPLPGLSTGQSADSEIAALSQRRPVTAEAEAEAGVEDVYVSRSGARGVGSARVAVSDPPEVPQPGASGGGGGASASPSLRDSPRAGSAATRLGGSGQVATISLKAGTGAKLINAPEPSTSPLPAEPLDLAVEDGERMPGDSQPLASVPVRAARPTASEAWPAPWPQRIDPSSMPSSMPSSTESAAVRLDPQAERGESRDRAGSRVAAPEGLDQLSESDLVRLLASVRPGLVSAAEQQLMQRGWSERLVRIAGTLAGGETDAKLLALDHLLAEPGVKATPWLLWMAEDGEPQVRRAAVERLARLGDPEVLRRVRLLLGRESDAAVRAAMQRVLISGGANPQEIR
jgi:hypothetical protein